MEALDCRGNFPDLGPIENACSYMKRHLRAMERKNTSEVKQQDAIKRLGALN